MDSIPAFFFFFFFFPLLTKCVSRPGLETNDWSRSNGTGLERGRFKAMSVLRFNFPDFFFKEHSFLSKAK